MTEALFVRSKAPSAGAVLFDPAGDATEDLFALTQPNGGMHFDPYTEPAEFEWQPVPEGWNLVERIDLRGLTALPSTVWPYGGAPGGTSGCLWQSSAISFEAGGVLFSAWWNGSVWVCAGLGTTGSWLAPLRVRTYEQFLDFNIANLNDIDLLWCAPWNTEVDYREWAVLAGLNGMSTSHLDIHNESPSDVIPQTAQSGAADLNPHCYEVQLLDSQVQTFTDSVATCSPIDIPAADWDLLTSNPHWAGRQRQMYEAGPGPYTPVSKLLVIGVEVLQPA